MADTSVSDQHPLADPEAALNGVDAILTTITAIEAATRCWTRMASCCRHCRMDRHVSATSVYPDKPEGYCLRTPPEPATARGRARVVAERRWQDMLKTEIFRAAGIYGPGRVPLTDYATAPRASSKTRGSSLTVSMLTTSAVSLSRHDHRDRRIINLADEAPQGDVVRHAASLLGVTPPMPQTLEEANLSPMARSFYVSRRKVASKVIGPELGLNLLYPDYESGLAAILKAERTRRLNTASPAMVDNDLDLLCRTKNERHSLVKMGWHNIHHRINTVVQTPPACSTRRRAQPHKHSEGVLFIPLALICRVEKHTPAGEDAPAIRHKRRHPAHVDCARSPSSPARHPST